MTPPPTGRKPLTKGRRRNKPPTEMRRRSCVADPRQSFLEAERIKYAIRLPANQILQHRIGYLLKRPGRTTRNCENYQVKTGVKT